MYAQVLLTFVGILLYVLYLKRKKQFQIFKKLGIPGPEPNILFGNFLEILKLNPLECQRRWIQKYGKIMGYYYGTRPVLLVTDLDLLKNVLIKDFQKFTDRPFVFREIATSNSPNNRTSLHLLNLRGKTWKHVRSLVTPSFTTSKMKLMSPIVNDCIDILLENIKEKRLSSGTFDIYGLYKRSTMDVIVKTAFGIQTDLQKNPDYPFVKLTALIFGAPFKFFYLLLISSFAIATPLFEFVRNIRDASSNKGYNPIEELLDRCEAVVKRRRNDSSLRRADLLQLLIDAEVKDDGKIDDGALTAEEAEKQDTDDVANSNKNTTRRRLSLDQIVANSFLFLAAGFDTISSSLAFTTMMLAHHPDVQENIRTEIYKLLEKEGEHQLDFGSVNQLEYLDQVFCEILRLYPPSYQFILREATENVAYDNIRIPKGTTVQSPTYLLHHDPELWPEPEEFNPERFTPENRKKRNPLAWQPFGAGPRNCVAMRYAQMLAKFTIAKILHKYRLLPSEETDKHPFNLKISPAILRPKYGVSIRVEDVESSDVIASKRNVFQD